MNRKTFFATIKKPLFRGSFTAGQVQGLDAILDEAALRCPSVFELSYMLATAYHEVGGTMQPHHENMNYSVERVREVWPSRFPTLASALPFANSPQKLANKVYGGRLGNDKPNDGWIYRGAGIPQITGKGMFAKMGALLGIDLVGRPELALDLKTSVSIMFVGMLKGVFTKKKLADYAAAHDYIGARAIINADGARNGEKIASYARVFEQALLAAGYTNKPAPEKKSGFLGALLALFSRR